MTQEFRSIEDHELPRYPLRWLGGWVHHECFYENFMACYKIGWGYHLLIHPHAEGLEPVSKALYQAAAIPSILVGVFLVTIAFLQLTATYTMQIHLRRACLLACFMFFTFSTFSFWKFAPNLPGSSVLPVLVAFSLLRFLMLSRRSL